MFNFNLKISVSLLRISQKKGKKIQVENKQMSMNFYIFFKSNYKLKLNRLHHIISHSRIFNRVFYGKYVLSFVNEKKTKKKQMLTFF